MGPMSPLGPGIPGGPICPGGPREPLGPELPERDIKRDRFTEEWYWEINGEMKQNNKQHIDKAYLQAQVALEVQVRTSASSSSFHWSSVYWPLCCLATRQSDEKKVKQNTQIIQGLSVSPTIGLDTTEQKHDRHYFIFFGSEAQKDQEHKICSQFYRNSKP